MIEVEWANMKAGDIRGLREKNAIAVVPIGSIEQHGPHLPVQVDTLLVSEVAVRTARLVAGHAPIVVLPTIWSGLAEHHMSLGGTLTLDFRPQTAGAADPAVQFAQGSRTVSFTVNPGDDRGYFGERAAAAFQTGTTAGILTFSVKLGDTADQQTVEIAPAPVGVNGVETARSGAGLEIRITGFDNARTAGPLAFTFYDRTGASLAPGAIRADGSAAFAKYFGQSETGGAFLLRAAFPVTGDPSLVDAVEVELANSAGATRSGRVKF